MNVKENVPSILSSSLLSKYNHTLSSFILTKQKQFFAYYHKLSKREQSLFTLLGIVGAVVIFALIKNAYTSTIELFENQSVTLIDFEDKINTRIPLEVRIFQQHRLSRELIEKKYKQVELREGTLSYLESLYKQVITDGQGGFKIDDSRPAQPFGVDYEKIPFALNFNVQNLEKLTLFLKELINGKQPFLITKLSIDKVYSGLDVTIDIVSITKKGSV
jgi:hypothetical protein